MINRFQQKRNARAKCAYAHAIFLKNRTVRYEAVNAMLLNEFLKEHQQKQIETLTAGLQKVSAQVEMSKPASQMVLNNQ